MPTPTYSLLTSYTVTATNVVNITFSSWTTNFAHMIIHISGGNNESADYFGIAFWQFGSTATSTTYLSARTITNRYNDWDTQFDSAKAGPQGYLNFPYFSGNLTTQSYGTWYTLFPIINDANRYKTLYSDGNQMSPNDTTFSSPWSQGGFAKFDASSAVTRINLYNASSFFKQNTTLDIYTLTTS